MNSNNKMPYAAPEVFATFLAVENAICQNSTSESFNPVVLYGDDWEEED